MKILRNREFLCHLIIQLGLLLLFSATAYWYGQPAGRLTVVFGLCLIICQCSFTAWRYRRLASLSRQLDDMLHHLKPIDFSIYHEGELAILTNELSKLTLRLSQQANALETDRQHLADSMADISHQLRSPLTSMSLILTMLKEPEVSSERRRQLLRELTMLLTRMDWLIEALLKLSRMDAGTVSFYPTQISAHRLAEDAAAPLLIPMELKGIAFQIRSESESVMLTVDPSWTAEALANILKNCMEHTPANGQITVTIRTNSLYTELLIQDSGNGFSSEDLPHLFERFYKGKNASDNSIGIGLALSRMIVSRQNGILKAENAKPHGALFTLRFYHENCHI
ncbi:MAG: HAMP domain-containing histidine kinase [Lachnospiraceae bacterium]|nr:HAMP domain-containing histidine kinase [Lachnospiraceae bacterium]